MVTIKKEDAIRMGGGPGKDSLYLIFGLNMFFTVLFFFTLVYETFNWKGKESMGLCIVILLVMVWGFPKIWRPFFCGVRERKRVLQGIQERCVLSNIKVEAGLEQGVKLEIV